MSDSAQPPVPPYAPRPQQGPGGYPAQPPGPTTRSATNTPGRVGMIIGLIGLALGLLASAIVQVLIRSSGRLSFDFGFGILSVVNGVGGFIAFAAAVAALILGLLGLRKVGVPHGQAGIATGLGIAGVVGGIFSFMLSVSAPLFY